MRIQALILARDESAQLSECVLSVRMAVDTVSIFDTGSRDQTREIACDQGAAWAPVSWSEDFGAARNAALNQIDAEWVLVIDADERLDSRAGARIRQALAQAADDDVAFHLEQRTYTDDFDALGYRGMPLSESVRRGVSGYVPRSEPRLLRLGRGLHYRGRVCERLHVRTGEALPPTAPTLGVLHHLHELQSLSRRKRMRQLRLRLALRAVLEQEDAEALARLGELLNRTRRWGAALKYLRRAEEYCEVGPLIHLQSGIARLQLGLVEGAIVSFRRAGATMPDHPEISTWLARALIQSNDPSRIPEAGVLLDHALEQAPELDQAILQRATWHRRRHELEDARAHLQTLLERNPVHPGALKELGAVALLQGLPLNSEQHLRQALRMRPNDPEILNNLGCALERRGHWREALEAFDRALQCEFGDPRTIRNRCLARAACQQWDAMCEDAERALLVSENPRELLLRLREDCLDASWFTALRRLEDWAVTEGWLAAEGRILSSTTGKSPELASS